MFKSRNALPLYQFFHGIRFKVRRLFVETTSNFFMYPPQGDANNSYNAYKIYGLGEDEGRLGICWPLSGKKWSNYPVATFVRMLFAIFAYKNR